MGVKTEEGERSEGKRWKEEEMRRCYCVRQPRRTREGDQGLDRRPFQVTTVCYPTCCSHVTSLMEGSKGRSFPPSSSLSVPPSCHLSVCFPLCFSCVSVAEAEHSSAAGHLASVAYSK